VKLTKKNLVQKIWRKFGKIKLKNKCVEKKNQEQNFRIENLKLNLGDKDFKNNFCRTKLSLEAKNL